MKEGSPRFPEDAASPSSGLSYFPGSVFHKSDVYFFNDFSMPKEFLKKLNRCGGKRNGLTLG
jgi:hypothetical protein